MLKFSIEVQCDDSRCMARASQEGTVEQPDRYAIPSLNDWSGPFKDWLFEEGQPSLCPMHARLEKARRAEEQAEQAEQASPAEEGATL